MRGCGRMYAAARLVTTKVTTVPELPKHTWRLREWVRRMKLTQEQGEKLLPAVQPPPSGIFKHFTEISPDSVCASCGLRLSSSEALIKIPGVPGVFCSNLCCEQGLIYDRQRCRACAAKLEEGRSAHYCGDTCRKSMADEPWGSGKRLLRWLALERPELYRKLFEGASEGDSAKVCLECGVRLEGRQTDFCSRTHMMRYRKSSTSQKCGISGKSSIENQRLTDAPNSGSTNTLTPPIQALETAHARLKQG